MWIKVTKNLYVNPDTREVVNYDELKAEITRVQLILDNPLELLPITDDLDPDVMSSRMEKNDRLLGEKATFIIILNNLLEKQAEINGN